MLGGGVLGGISGWGGAISVLGAQLRVGSLGAAGGFQPGAEVGGADCWKPLVTGGPGFGGGAWGSTVDCCGVVNGRPHWGQLPWRPAWAGCTDISKVQLLQRK